MQVEGVGSICEMTVQVAVEGQRLEVERIPVARAGGAVEVMEVAECGHSPHRDQMEAVLGRITRFVGEIAGNKSVGGGV
jgi:hypothetical protein